MSSEAEPREARAEAIPRFLGAVRARLRLERALAGASAWAILVGAGILGLLILAAAIGPSAIWRPLGLFALIAALAGGALAVAAVVRAFHSDDAVARFVGGRVPEVGDELLSAVELERARPEMARRPGLSTELVTALAARVAGRVEKIAPAQLVDLKRLERRIVLGLGAVATGYLVVGMAWPGTLGRGLQAMRAPRFDHFATAREPIVGDLRLELHYPAYTKLPPRVIPSSSGQVLALPGTEVRIRARALKPAPRARLILSADDRPPDRAPEVKAVEVSDDGMLSTRFVADKPGTYRFVLEGAGRPVQEPEPHRIDLEPDRAPRVDLYAPAETLEVAGPRRIELGYSVDDDYGLSAIELVWRAGNGPEKRQRIWPDPANQKSGTTPRAAAGKQVWDLAATDLKPGVRVAYHLEAKDNDTVPAPNVGMSRTFYLTMFDPRAKHDASMADEQQLLELAISQLADRLELGKTGDVETLNAFVRLRAKAEELIGALAKVEEGLAADPEASAQTKKELGEMHTRLAKLGHDEAQLTDELRDRARRGTLKSGQSRGLDAGNTKQVSELERDVIALDNLLGRQRLEELLAVGDEMTRARDRLKQLFAQYKKSRSPEVRQEIERELRDLAAKIAELQQRAQKLASELPDQFLNPEAMGKNDLQSQLDEVQKRLAKGDVDGAMAAMEQMSSALDKMMASMEGDLRGFRRERFSAEDKQMAEVQNQLSDLAHDEQQIKQETDEVRARTEKEAQKQMRDKIAPVVKRARDQVAALKRHLQAIGPDDLPPYEHDDFDRMKQRVDDLDRTLKDGDIDEARGMAEETEHGLGSIDRDLREQAERGWRGEQPNQKSARGHVEDGAKLAQKIGDELDKALPQPGQLMSPDDQKKMQELAERQQAARRRARSIGQKLDSQGKRGPDGKSAIPPEIGAGLKQAGQHMDRAASQLKRRATPDASGEEQQALDSLDKMKQQLEEERRPKQRFAGQQLDKEPVKIPGADEYKAPKEFRQDLLDAMKRRAPADYKEQVKRYYEELVK